MSDAEHEPGSPHRSLPAAPKRGIWGRVVLLIGIATVTMTIVGAVMVYRSIKGLFEAEHRLHAMYFVCELVGDYVDANNGARWPASWAELELQPQPYESYLQWPRDTVRIQELVAIDFSVTVEQAATQPIESYTAVAPTPGPDVALHTWASIQLLRERLAKYIPKASEP